MPIGTNKHWRVIRIMMITVAGIILLSLALRNPLLNLVLQRKIDRFNRHYDAELSIDKARIRWFSSLRITGIMLKPVHGDTLIRIDTVTARLSFTGLLAGKISMNGIELKHTCLSFLRRDTLTNYMFLVERRRPKSVRDTAGTEHDYAHSTAVMLEAVFNKVPDELLIDDFRVIADADGHKVSMGMERLQIRDHAFEAMVRVEEDSVTRQWKLNGRLDKHAGLADFMLVSADTLPVRLPYLKFRWDGDILFDTLAFRIFRQPGNDTLVTIVGSAQLSGFSVSHPGFAAREVSFGRMGIDYTVNIGKSYLELDSATTITFNRLTFHPYIKYRPHPASQITIMVHKPPFPAQDLFTSLPKGLFETIEGIRVSGELSYHLDFFVDLSEPDSLRFDSELKRHHFSVQSYGEGTLLKMSESFEYTAYEHGIPVRTFIVGPENPDFRALDRISPFLRGAVITSEDGGFYEHRGFLMDAIRESLATNIKERRFARGGSTITMQLMKNVFLSRQKTLARKAEEILITWLIENQQVYTKDRMFEVYLNIIEWAPMVYGASEASRFYFKKDVSKLTLGEAIFMASVIPAPKWYKSSIDSTGHLKPHLEEFYRLVTEKMLQKGRITKEEFDNVTLPVIRL